MAALSRRDWVPPACEELVQAIAAETFGAKYAEIRVAAGSITAVGRNKKWQ